MIFFKNQGVSANVLGRGISPRFSGRFAEDFGVLRRQIRIHQQFPSYQRIHFRRTGGENPNEIKHLKNPKENYGEDL